MMKLMYRLRKKRPDSYLSPDGLAIRTVQSPWHLVPDPGKKTFSVYRTAYNASADGGVSVDLSQLWVEDGFSFKRISSTVRNAVGAVAHQVGFVRAQGLSAHHEKIPENWYHGGIRGNLDRGTRRLLAEKCQVVVAIDVEAARKHWEEVHSELPF